MSDEDTGQVWALGGEEVEGSRVNFTVVETVVDYDGKMLQFKTAWMHTDDQEAHEGLFARFVFESRDDFPPQAALVQFLAERCKLAPDLCTLIISETLRHVDNKSAARDARKGKSNG